MWRVYCRFNPNFKRADGGRVFGPMQARKGAWTVLANHVADFGQERPVVGVFGECLRVLCPTPRKPGTRVNPRKLLAEFLAHRARAHGRWRAAQVHANA